MSRFFSSKYDSLTPYVPGEQPQDRSYVKLNTNENPFQPSEKAQRVAAEYDRPLNLYSDPACRILTECLAETYGVSPSQVIVNNGSDETLNFAFMAFCDADHPAVFPNITYGFYPVFAALNGVPYEEIPLLPDLTVDVGRFCGVGKTVFIANPNAPTGILLPLSAIEKIVRSNPDNVVVIDEAYIDFGGESCVPLVEKYENLLVVQTFSKSRSMAGARLGFGIGSETLIRDLQTLRFSTNPYNVNSMTLAAGIGALADPEYTAKCCDTIVKTREKTAARLRALGFEMPESAANFVFAKTPKMDGGALYLALKERGILVRHFDRQEIKQYNRITIGTDEQMDILLETLADILNG